MPFKFAALRTYPRELQNDLRSLEREVKRLEDKVARLTTTDSIGITATSLSVHASTHFDGGSDIISGGDFTWTGGHDFSGATITPDFEFNTDTDDLYIHEKLTPVATTGLWTHAALSVFNGKVGIGTATVPHAGVGNPSTVLALDATGGSGAGPHIEMSVASDNFPVMQLFIGGHGNGAVAFDAYNDGTNWETSAKHGARIKITGSGNSEWHGLYFQTYSGELAGRTISDWDNRLRFHESGPIQMWSGNSFLVLGGDTVDLGSCTVASDKSSHIVCPAYQHGDDASLFIPVSMIGCLVKVNSHVLRFGGGTANTTCANEIQWWTGVDQAETTGTQRLTLDEPGELYHGTIAGNDKYIYESLSPTLTGTWDFDSATISGLDHVDLANKGTNTHAQIDTHLASTKVHSFAPLHVVFGTREVSYA